MCCVIAFVSPASAAIIFATGQNNGDTSHTSGNYYYRIDTATGVARRDLDEAAGLAGEVASQRPELAETLYVSLAEQAIDTGKLDEATELLQDLADNDTDAPLVQALSTGIRTALGHRGEAVLAEWELRQAGTAWERSSAGPPN
jgi:predicted Zn-dependent protease